jgi:hypothetical protein
MHSAWQSFSFAFGGKVSRRVFFFVVPNVFLSSSQKVPQDVPSSTTPFVGHVQPKVILISHVYAPQSRGAQIMNK